MENYKKYEALPKNGQIFLEYQAERRIYSCTCEQDFFEQDEAGYEYMLRQLKQHLVSHDIPLSLFCNIGTIIRHEELEKNKISSKEVFLFVDENSLTEQCEVIPAETYVCLCCDDFAKEAENAAKLLDYIKQTGYKIAGDYLCEAIIDFPVLEEKKRHIFSKIQIPAVFGKDVSEIIGNDYQAVGVSVTPAAEAEKVISELKPDVCIIATRSTVAELEDIFTICAKNGVNAITTCEESLYPWNSSPALTAKLDTLAKEAGCTLTGVGYCDLFWGTMVTNLMGSSFEVKKSWAAAGMI